MVSIVPMKVEYIDHLGDDLRVTNAARVSFENESDWAPVGEWDYAKVLQPRDEKLINYLAKNNHISPFFHCVLTLRLKVPIFIARQLDKHQVRILSLWGYQYSYIYWR